MLEKTWDFIVRQRTRLFNSIGMLVMLLPAIVGAPEIIAIIPPKYLPYVMAAMFLINYLMRPRPATRAADPEVKVAKAIKEADETTIVSVKEVGKAAVVVATVTPTGTASG